jgi:DNA topoisomerase IA
MQAALRLVPELEAEIQQFKSKKAWQDQNIALKEENKYLRTEIQRLVAALGAIADATAFDVARNPLKALRDYETFARKALEGANDDH